MYGSGTCDEEVDRVSLHFRQVESRNGYMVAGVEARIRHFEGHGVFGDVAENANCQKVS